MLIEFHVPAVPVAQPRQRVAVIAGHPHTYTPAKAPVNAYKAAVQQAYAARWSVPMFHVPIALSVTFLMPRPQRLQWKRRAMPRVPHTSTPDLDNLLKSTKDALTKLAWSDDSQVQSYRECSKWYAAGDEQPHVEVRIETLENGA